MANGLKNLTPYERYELCALLENENWHSIVEKMGLYDYPMAKPPVPVMDTKEPQNTEGGDINWLFVFGVGFAAIAAFHLFVK